MKTIYINGRFLKQKITGEQRYALELLKEWDEINDKHIKFVLLCPKGTNAKDKVKLKNIEALEIGKFDNQLWLHFSLPRFVKKKKGTLITLCGLSPIFRPDYWTVHDITFIRNPESFNWKFKLLYRFVYRVNLKRAKKIFTVSNFSKKEISDYYKINPQKIEVKYSAISNDFLKRESQKYNCCFEKKQPIILSVGSIKANKNIGYIYKLARKNPDLNFLIAGGKHNAFCNVDYDELDNLKFTDYISDEQLVFLYQSADAFIMPSTYEGFGLPPLEAIACGCKKILLSNIDVLKEIYDVGCNFFNPYDDGFEISLNDLFTIDEQKYNYYINKYNFKKIAFEYLKALK